MRKYYGLLLLLTIVFVGCNDKYEITPSKPEPGQLVKIHLPESKTTLSAADSIYAYVYAIKENTKNDEVIDVFLTRKDKAFDGEFTIPADAVAVYVHFEAKDEIDNNEGKGYGFTLFKDGKELSNSKLYLLATMRANSYYWNEHSFIPGLFSDFKQTYQQHGTAWSTKDLLKYYTTYTRVADKVDTAYQLKLLQELADKNDLTQTEASSVRENFKLLGDTTVHENLNKLIGDFDPQNPAANVVWTLYDLKTADEKDAMLKSIMDTIRPELKKEDDFQYMLFYTGLAYVNEGKFEKAKSYEQYFENAALKNQVNNQIINKITGKDYKMTTADDALINSIINTPVGKESVKRANTDSYNMYQKQIKNASSAQLLNKAKYLDKTGKTDEANAIFGQLAADDYSFWGYGERYFNLLIEKGEYAKATDLWKQMRKNSFVNDQVDSVLKAKFAEGLVTGTTWEELEKTTNADITEKSKEKILKHFTSIPAPKFELTDLKGNPVNFDQYKGKKLMIDFWATWCGPCIASFPEMKQLQEHFAKADTTVQFLFVLTLERGEKEALIKNAEKLLEAQQLPFFVILDHPSGYVNQFQISAIPCKVFVDQNGNFRYKSIGYMRGYEKNLSDFETIFSLMDKK
jgi:thiol-disulfide isomerase/thioredoxin